MENANQIESSKSKFSIFQNGIKNTIPIGEIDILSFLKKLKEKNSLIEKIRKTKTKNEKDNLKSNLSYVTFAGIFSKRSRKNLIKSSGLSCLDFDELENLEETKRKLIKDKFTHCVFVSPSGKGLKLIVKIPEIKNDEEYKEYWESIAKHYNVENIDNGTKDISRACYLSYDENYYFNEKSEIFTKKCGSEISNFVNVLNPDLKKYGDKWKTDPVIQYCLENTINNGSRNNTLFKNIAILLAYSNATNEDRKDIVNRIIANCPGKNINEFEGQLRKAIEGEYNFFNIIEMNNWIDKYKLDIPKYEIAQYLDFNDNYVKESFLSMFKMIDPNSKFMPVKIATFYHLCGAMLIKNPITHKMLNIDMRFNFGVCVESGKGKTAIKNVIKETAERLSKKYNEFTSLHEEQLIGKRWKDKKTGKVNECLGYLADDFLVKDDALSLINSPKYEIARNYILSALDVYGENQISKSLTEMMNDRLQYLANTSFLFFIQPSEKIIVKNLTNGFFRRSPILRINLTQSEIKSIVNDMLIAEYNIKPAEWIKFLLFLQNIQNSQNYEYKEFSKKIVDLIINSSNKYISKNNLLSNLDFINLNNIVRFSYINALLRFFVSNKNLDNLNILEIEVIEEDVNKAVRDYDYIYHSIKDFVYDNKVSGLNDEEQLIMEILLKNNAKTQETAMISEDFFKELQTQNGTSESTLRKYYYKLKKEEAIKTKQRQHDSIVWLG